MDEVRVVRRRTHVWPVVIALIVLALVIAWALFAINGGAVPRLGGTPPPSQHLVGTLAGDVLTVAAHRPVIRA